MRQRRWMYRLAGGGCLVLGTLLATVVLAGGGLFPRNANPFLSRKETASSEAAQYYSTMGAPATLAAWQTLYFPASGGTRASANYYNAGDLGFGREMHCYEQLEFTACYVANHGLGAGAPAEISVQDTIGNARNLPTVAMVYDYTIDGQPNDVRFYVYAPNGNLLTQVGLDSEGDKSVPGLCLACHGGTYDAGTNQVTGAQFLPWDLESFAYSPTPGWTRAAQTEQFRVLNAMVRNTLPDAKIASLIDGWYGGVNAVYNSNAVFNDAYVPAAYSAPTDQVLYNLVVKPYCRGCHMAQAFDLETPSQLDSAFGAVFVSRDMPHAQLTNHRFWSTNGPFYLARRFAGTSTFVVTKTQDTNDGTCDPDCSLREAVAAANASADYSVIIFEAPGTFTLTLGGVEDNNAGGDLDLRTNMTILGNSIQATILSGNNSDRVLHIQNGADVLIQNVQITGGHSSVGAGIWVHGTGSDLLLNHSVVQGNTASLDGGGLAVDEFASAEVHQSAFFYNDAAGHGGGVFVDYQSHVTLFDTTLANNSADLGGAVYTNNGSSTSLDYVTAILNTADTTGRALLTFDGSTTNVGRSIVGGNLGGGSECYADGTSGAVQNSNGYNRVGQSGSASGCSTAGPGDQVIAGLIESVVRLDLAYDPQQGVWGLYPQAGGAAVDAIPLGVSCSTPAYDAFNHARPRDADNNGVVRCDIGALEYVTTPVYIPLVNR